MLPAGFLNCRDQHPFLLRAASTGKPSGLFEFSIDLDGDAFAVVNVNLFFDIVHVYCQDSILKLFHGFQSVVFDNPLEAAILVFKDGKTTGLLLVLFTSRNV